MKRKVKSFFKGFGLSILIIFLVFMAFLAYGHIDNRWYKLIYIKSDSMSPTFKAGDLICITKPPYEIKPGMIICFQIKGDIVTHRVVGIDENGNFITKGDANKVPDDWGEYQIKKVAGVYRFKIPYLGYPIAYGSYWVKKAALEAGNFLGKVMDKIGSLFTGSGAYFTNQGKILISITAESLVENPPENPAGNLTQNSAENPPENSSDNLPEGENPNSGEDQKTTENPPVEDKPPIIDVFNINNNELTTNSYEVVLNLSVSDDITPPEKLQMRLANDGETWADENTGWEIYSTNKSWQLSEGEGEKKVCLQVKDEKGNLASTSATINYQPPTVDDENLSNDNTNTEEVVIEGEEKQN